MNNNVIRENEKSFFKKRQEKASMNHFPVNHKRTAMQFMHGVEILKS